MKIQESGEMYLETIMLLHQKKGAVRSIDISEHMGFSKPSVSRAMGLLKSDNLILIDTHGLISLTETGEAIASKILERHHILTKFLVKIGIDNTIASEDACKIEHVISDTTFEKIKEFTK